MKPIIAAIFRRCILPLFFVSILLWLPIPLYADYVTANKAATLTVEHTDFIEEYTSPWTTNVTDTHEFKATKMAYAHFAMSVYLRKFGKLSQARKELQIALKYADISPFLHLQLADLNIQLRDIKSAEAEANKAKELDEQNSDAYFVLGKINLIRGKKENAKRNFARAVELNPDHLNAQIKLADLAFGEHDYKSAINVCQELVRIRPYEPQYHYHLGKAYLNDGQIDAAVEHFQTALKIYDKYQSARRALAEIYKYQKKLEEAAKEYREILAINPPDAIRIRGNLADIYLKLGQYKEATEQCEIILQTNPNDMRIREALATIYFEIGRYEEAILMSQQLLQNDPNNTQAREVLARVYIQQEKYDEATSQCQEILRAHPDDIEILAMLGSLYLAMENADESIRLLKKVLDKAPDNEDANYWIAMAYEIKGDVDNAVKYMRETIRINPKRHEAYNALGYFFADRGINLPEAVQLIQQALDAEPENGAYIDSLGWAYFKLGRTDDALVELEKAVKYFPNSAEVRDHLGDVYLKKGLTEKAIDQWKKALELEPDNEKLQAKLRMYQID
ncbi:TPA: tetratricopeptide repeat protein [Candidatus Poribacteria bacterium]|nr:tetratricopeptide repeat protein [Candidatus Poribacteria bacterium]